MPNKYNSRMSIFNVLEGENTIIGFQKAINNEDKVFIWMRGFVNRPLYSNLKNIGADAKYFKREREWSKSLWKIDNVLRHLHRQLDKLGISEHRFVDLQNDYISDKWVTKNDGERNFFKAIIPDPFSELTGMYFTIQIEQSLNPSVDIFKRAEIEGKSQLEKKMLIHKYSESSKIKKYTPISIKKNGEIINTKELREIEIVINNKKYSIYEQSKIVLGIPNNKFIDYTKHNYNLVNTNKKSIIEDNLNNKQISIKEFDINNRNSLI